MPTTDLLSVDSLTSGTALTTTNTTPALAGGVNASSGSTVVADSASLPSGYSSGNGIKVSWTTSGGPGDFRMNLPSTGQSASNVYRDSFYYRTTNVTPGADITLFQLNASAKAFTLTQRATNAGFRILDATGANALDASGTYAWNTYYRIELQADNSGGTTTTGKLTVNIYDMSSTLVGTATSSTYNLSTGTFSQWRRGASGYNATAGNHAFFAARWADGGTGDIGAYTPPLSTPVVTLGTTTNPTTVGGSNGSQVVSWGAVTSASSYDAYIAHNTSPAQSDFTLVTTGVTSPYTFTSLSAGPYAFGIEAKP